MIGDCESIAGRTGVPEAEACWPIQYGYAVKRRAK
jgi:hypothetical protein